MRILRPILLSVAALCLLSACIAVDDFGSAWEEAKPDACLQTIAKQFYTDQILSKDESFEARSLEVNGQHFALVKGKAGDKGGNLYRYEISSNVYISYRLKPTMRKTFLRDYPEAPVKVTDDRVTIHTLDEPSRALLADIANSKEYWEVAEKTLYNVQRLPECTLAPVPQDE